MKEEQQEREEQEEGKNEILWLLKEDIMITLRMKIIINTNLKYESYHIQ